MGSGTLQSLWTWLIAETWEAIVDGQEFVLCKLPIKLHMSDREQGNSRTELDERQNSCNGFQFLKYACWVADDKDAQSNCWLIGLKCKSCVVAALFAGVLTMGPRLWPPEI